ncbi:5-dehydro-4-deoxy-D-glucuronate isomerase [Spirosoma utsteinense]|uniref:4-deoxy-L-threo-5-hexosulose-uronate ketol-isomerase n=1 Tax=Spirosoma utsteinense TaxID=2585773 RepID=A0ABR6WBQ3_9BACT|nr:4-deoxy-L-threo-5-hexosulose-uronate ketol-isomerase [Spirosoma utsteinense]MBC3793971.1 4-deoxy-L-threo-5-hexosulose-uronate ketol-isomerase [Spirosoma utsteinense]
MMHVRYATSPTETKQFTTDQLRENFLIESVFVPDALSLVYSHFDRIIVGGVMPVAGAVTLPTYDELKSTSFLERRELGIINVGGAGTVTVDGQTVDLARLDCLYVGRGSASVVFASTDPAQPAQFYLLSAPAHTTYPTQKAAGTEVFSAVMGSSATANERTIYRYIHKDGLQSCQLVMGLTILQPGSVWNTMPAHVHDRRMEAYFYFDLDPDHRVLHLMGQPTETRHIVVANHQAVVSPPWSIHSGCGTASYSFIWGMGGENMDYADMDMTAIAELR